MQYVKVKSNYLIFQIRLFSFWIDLQEMWITGTSVRMPSSWARLAAGGWVSLARFSRSHSQPRKHQGNDNLGNNSPFLKYCFSPQNQILHEHIYLLHIKSLNFIWIDYCNRRDILALGMLISELLSGKVTSESNNKISNLIKRILY